MTYRELAEYISNLTDEQKDSEVTVYVSGEPEYYSLVRDYPVGESESWDVLSENHPYLVI
jgi:hypothetical protein